MRNLLLLTKGETMRKPIGEPSLDPPSSWDAETCASCYEEIEGEPVLVEKPRPGAWRGDIWACSPGCADRYLDDWADYMVDMMESRHG